MNLLSHTWSAFSRYALSTVYAGINSTAESAHNFYIEYWYFFGLLGVILFVAFITATGKVINRFMNRAHFKKQILILLIPIMFRAMAISLVAFMNFWLSLCLVVAMLNYDDNKETEKMLKATDIL